MGEMFSHIAESMDTLPTHPEEQEDPRAASQPTGAPGGKVMNLARGATRSRPSLAHTGRPIAQVKHIPDPVSLLLL